MLCDGHRVCNGVGEETLTTMKKTTTKWTVMVYMAGDNNLDGAAMDDLDEIKATGSTDAVHVVAQVDRRGAGRPTRRYFLQHGTSLNADAVASLGETNTGDPAALVDFVKWAVHSHPAEHYALVLWNHGAGWDDTDIYRSVREAVRVSLHRRGRVVDRAPGEARGTLARVLLRKAFQAGLKRAFFRSSAIEAVREAAEAGSPDVARAILLDDNAKDFLDNREMRSALKQVNDLLGRRLDVLGMDACLMNMAEVLYQVRDLVDYVVGSEQTEPGDGWPYDTVLSVLKSAPATTPEALSRAVVTKYLASYGASSGVTQSALRVDRAQGLADAMKALAASARSHLGSSAFVDAVTLALASTRRYDVEDNKDLVHFCELLSAKAAAWPDVVASCKAVITAVQPAAGSVIESGFKGASVTHSNGLAFYFPVTGVSPLYATLDYEGATHWGAFVKAYIAALTA